MTKLNPPQRAAVQHRDGPLLILAGAGSGKTRVVTHRIAGLVGDGVPPDKILAVTFTNRAAGEMRERMVSLIGRGPAAKLAMSTFHSFGVRFIHTEKQALGLGNRWVIFDQADSLGVVKDILRELRDSGAARKLDPMQILSRLSNWKNELLDAEDVPESDYEYDDIAGEVYPEYEARLRAMRALDFDDLVVAPVRLLRDDPAVRQRWQERFTHLLIDEFQDTSRVQLELVKLMTGPRRNVCVVGDDDQSIYGWRGADVSNILDFDKTFPGTTVVKLEDNYRSTPAVLEVANAAISQSKSRHGKVLRAARPPADRVRMCVLEDQAQEAKFVALEIGELLQGGQRASGVAVLYRSNLQARLIEEELTAQAIPYRLFGGTQLFDRREVKDTAAYLRAVINPRDDISIRRIVNYPSRGVGARTVERIDEYASACGMSFRKALESVERIEDIPPNAARSIAELTTMLQHGSDEIDAGGSLHAVARGIVDKVRIREDLMSAADGSKQGPARCGNVDNLLGWLDRYERESDGDRRSLQGFLERVTLRGDAAEEVEGERVVLSTLHASKGLEFPVVFLIGCVEGQLPHSRTTDPKVSEAAAADVDEERRLFYVGVTRAQDRLYLCRSHQKTLRGKATKVAPSRFLDGLPEESIEEYGRSDAGAVDFDEAAQMGRELLEQLKKRPQP